MHVLSILSHTDEVCRERISAPPTPPPFPSFHRNYCRRLQVFFNILMYQKKKQASFSRVPYFVRWKIDNAAGTRSALPGKLLTMFRHVR